MFLCCKVFSSAQQYQMFIMVYRFWILWAAHTVFFLKQGEQGTFSLSPSHVSEETLMKEWSKMSTHAQCRKFNLIVLLVLSSCSSSVCITIDGGGGGCHCRCSLSSITVTISSNSNINSFSCHVIMLFVVYIPTYC